MTAIVVPGSNADVAAAAAVCEILLGTERAGCSGKPLQNVRRTHSFEVGGRGSMPGETGEKAEKAEKTEKADDAHALRRLARLTYRGARRISVAIVGATLLAIGVVLVFTPGPAIVLLALGLAVLALEFAWARRWLKRLREGAAAATGAAREDDTDRPGSREGERDRR